MNLNIIENFRNDLRHHLIPLHYQTVINYQENSVFSMEALLNWSKIKEYDVSLEALISEVETNETLCLELDRYVATTALHEFNSICTEYPYSGSISINICPRSLETLDFVDFLKDLIQSLNKMQFSRLIIEITERNEWLHPALILENIKRLRKMGVQVAVDDFITGYSNFGTLLNEDVRIVKLDKSLTARLLTDKMVRKFFSSFYALSQQLGKEVIVEGVEKIEQALILRSEGYALLQGYYFSRPMKKELMVRYLKGLESV
ncbi:hypothetical protein CWE09_03745 [Aliidiomarina minuta]|uniref:EAL domain-containing protein n=1 Tax=Aliidiomarina minuta TaxID=880057 RepID=A0A432W6Z7_9GAMM|nr:EAL domain-containing protein [Aliidiomarina minuta]RUO25853.1 hypothetical protein CWE09_03745 [Aliidiomarina minuta]